MELAWSQRRRSTSVRRPNFNKTFALADGCGEVELDGQICHNCLHGRRDGRLIVSAGQNKPRLPSWLGLRDLWIFVIPETAQSIPRV